MFVSFYFDMMVVSVVELSLLVWKASDRFLTWHIQLSGVRAKKGHVLTRVCRAIIHTLNISLRFNGNWVEMLDEHLDISFPMFF